MQTAHRGDDPDAALQNFDFRSERLRDYDVLWLFGFEGNNDGAVHGTPIADGEIAAVFDFMNAGGGVFATGDHSGMGSFMCGRIPRVRTMRKWFGVEYRPADAPTHALDWRGEVVTAANWPAKSVPGGLDRADTLVFNPRGGIAADGALVRDTESLYQFDNQSDDIAQTLVLDPPVHSILRRADGASITRFPDHMHEGEVVTPADLEAVVAPEDTPVPEYPSVDGVRPAPRVIATGTATAGHSVALTADPCLSGNPPGDPAPSVAMTIGILCAYDGLPAGVGRIVTDSSFHHYVDVNLIGDPCGSTPDRRRGFGTPYRPPAPGSVLADLGTCYVNIVRWLAADDLRRQPVRGQAQTTSPVHFRSHAGFAAAG
ncbi:hypothetical protein, partial [Nocardia xishanensis]|uniref:hypothetical protein n=1 Tax=Nocardia xishanensis TaxID=238964 RepID=UPI0034249F11